MKWAQERIFLLDGAGALLSALSLGVLLPCMRSFVGLPMFILHSLSLLALVYALYDFCCFKWANKTNPLWLTLIVAANLSYLVFTLCILISYQQSLELLGALYFIAELFVLSGLIFYELKLIVQLKNQKNREHMRSFLSEN